MSINKPGRPIDILPNCDEIAKLTAYLPVIERWDQPFATWVTSSGTFPYPHYQKWVETLFFHDITEVWYDYDYMRKQKDSFHTNDHIAGASLQDIMSMLTYCLRAERFCDGVIDSKLNDGYILNILRRLASIESEWCLTDTEETDVATGG